MIIMESAIAMNNEYVECVKSLGKINVFAEASYTELQINLKEAALKVLKENGTDEDYEFLANEAANSYIERAEKAIAKIVEAIRKFIRTCKENLIRLVTNAKTKLAIDRAEDICARNPGLRSKKVEYCEPGKRISVLQQGLDKIRKKVSKIRAKGIATDDDRDEINKIKEETLKKATVISVAAVATLGTAIAIFKKCNSKSEVDRTLNEESANECDIQVCPNTAKDAKTADVLRTAASAMAEVKREITRWTVAKSSKLLAAIKGVFTSGKKNVENIEESVGFEDLTMFDVYTESEKEQIDSDSDVTVESTSEPVEGLDLDAYFTEMCNEIFAENTTDDEVSTDTEVSSDADINGTDESSTEVEQPVEESTDTESDAQTSEVYLEQLEHEIFGETEEVATESTDADNAPEAKTAKSLLEEMETML